MKGPPVLVRRAPVVANAHNPRYVKFYEETLPPTHSFDRESLLARLTVNEISVGREDAVEIVERRREVERAAHRAREVGEVVVQAVTR